MSLSNINYMLSSKNKFINIKTRGQTPLVFIIISNLYSYYQFLLTETKCRKAIDSNITLKYFISNLFFYFLKFYLLTNGVVVMDGVGFEGSPGTIRISEANLTDDMYPIIANQISSLLADYYQEYLKNKK